MSIRTVCDRCEKVKGDEAYSEIKFKYYVDGKESDEPENYYYDLCPECARLYSIFINGGTVEEDPHKDSNPCAVVIHKLADSGHYAIENVSEDDPIKKAKAWNKALDTVFTTKDSMNKEESDLSVECHTNAAGVTVPDTQPWGTPGVKRPIMTGQHEDTNPPPCKKCGMNPASCCGCDEYTEWEEKGEHE